MCLVHSPGAPPPPPPPQYLHNPFLDGASMTNGIQRGRNSLVTFGNGRMPAPVAQVGAPLTRMPGPAAPSQGVTLPSGTLPPVGQPGTVVPTVGGALAGQLPGRMAAPLPVMRGPASR